MKISELIAELCDARKECGDLEVVVYPGEARRRCIVYDAAAWPNKRGKMECVLAWSERDL